MAGKLTQLYRLIRYGLPLRRLVPDGDVTLADLIERQVEKRGDHPVVLYEDRQLSYREYNEIANRFAHWAISRGLRTGDVVALLMENRPEFLCVWAGLAKVGITAALINTNQPGRALHHAISESGAGLAIVGSECLALYETLDGDATWKLAIVREEGESDEAAARFPENAEDLTAALGTQPTGNPPREVRVNARTGDELFYIYTSGTTGLPKAARFSHIKFVSAGTAARFAGFGPKDIMYCALPLYHSAGGAMAAGAVLLSGGTLALRRRFSASQFWEDIRRYDATAFQYIGEFCRYLLNRPADPKDGQHRIKLIIGNGLRPDIWEEFRDRFRLPSIIEFYGATEGNVAMLNMDNKVGSVGRIPLKGMMDARLIRYDVEKDEYLLDENGHCIECEPGEVGELIGAMPSTSDDARGRFEGYTSKAATEKKILSDAFEDGDLFFRTGDLLKADAEGYFYFIDRIGDTFRWKGENVSTQEVAEAVGVYPGVQMTNVYGVEVAGTDGRAGMAALVLEDPTAFDGAAFYELVSGALPSYAAPVFVRLQKEPEVTGTFKLKKGDLQDQGYDRSQVEDPLFVRDDAAGRYVELTAERLRALETGELRI